MPLYAEGVPDQILHLDMVEKNDQESGILIILILPSARQGDAKEYCQ